MHYFAFFKLGSHLQFYHTVTHVFIPFIFLQPKGWFEGPHSPLIFPVLHCPIFPTFMRLFLSWISFLILLTLQRHPSKVCQYDSRTTWQLKQAVRGGNHRLYKNITLSWPAKVKQLRHLSWDPQSFNFISTSCYPSFHPMLSSIQSLMVTSLNFKHWQFTLTFHFLSFNSSSALKSTSSLIKRMFKFLLGFLARDFIKRILEIRI